MERGQATGEEEATAKLREELDQLKADVADLQSLRADVDSLKAMFESQHAAVPQGPFRHAGPKKLTMRAAAFSARLQLSSGFSNSATRFGTPTSRAGEGPEQEPEPEIKWNKAKAKISVIGRLAASTRMKRLRTQVHHSISVDGADADSALNAGRAAAAERVSIVDIAQDENLLQSHQTPSPVGGESMSAAQQGPENLHVEGNPGNCEGGASRVGRESSGLRMIVKDDHDDDAQEHRKARNSPTSEWYPPPAGVLNERSGCSLQPPYLPPPLPPLPPLHTHHNRAGNSTNTITKVHRNSANASTLKNRSGALVPGMSTTETGEGDSTDEGDGMDAEDGSAAMMSSVMTISLRDLKKKQSVWREDDSWVQHTQNAYGAFAHVAMQSGIMRAIKMCGPMLIASIMIQSVFAAQLLNNHWSDMVWRGQMLEIKSVRHCCFDG